MHISSCTFFNEKIKIKSEICFDSKWWKNLLESFKNVKLKSFENFNLNYWRIFSFLRHNETRWRQEFVFHHYWISLLKIIFFVKFEIGSVRISNRKCLKNSSTTMIVDLFIDFVLFNLYSLVSSIHLLYNKNFHEINLKMKSLKIFFYQFVRVRIFPFIFSHQKFIERCKIMDFFIEISSSSSWMRNLEDYLFLSRLLSLVSL